MAKSAKSEAASPSILTTRSWEFFKNYINNPSPVGFESSGQRLWLEIDLPYEAARSRVFLARAYEALGHQEESALELDAASAVFERLGARADLARLADLRQAS